MGVARGQDLGLNALERGQIPILGSADVDGMNLPILVASLVLQVEDVVTVRGPGVDADAAIRVVGDHACGGRFAQRGDPDVLHPIDRRQEADRRAVRADPPTKALGVAKQRLTRDQLDVRLSQGDRSRITAVAWWPSTTGQYGGESENCK